MGFITSQPRHSWPRYSAIRRWVTTQSSRQTVGGYRSCSLQSRCFQSGLTSLLVKLQFQITPLVLKFNRFNSEVFRRCALRVLNKDEVTIATFCIALSGRPILAVDGCPFEYVKKCLVQRTLATTKNIMLHEIGRRPHSG